MKKIKIQGIPKCYEMCEIMIAYLNGKEMEEENMPGYLHKHFEKQGKSHFKEVDNKTII